MLNADLSISKHSGAQDIATVWAVFSLLAIALHLHTNSFWTDTQGLILFCLKLYMSWLQNFTMSTESHICCLYCFSLFFQMIKSRRMNLVWHEAHTGEEEKYIHGFGGKTCSGETCRKESTRKSQVKMGE